MLIALHFTSKTRLATDDYFSWPDKAAAVVTQTYFTSIESMLIIFIIIFNYMQ